MEPNALNESTIAKVSDYLTNVDKKSSNQLAKNDHLSLLFDFERDFAGLPLKSDHHLRPIWISPTAHIFLESFSPIYQQAYDFLVAISEPVTRQRFIHEYAITPYSLYAAVSIGLDTNDILQVLSRLCKTPLPSGLSQFVIKVTERVGKLRLVLRGGRYLIESNHFAAIKTIVDDPSLKDKISPLNAEDEALLQDDRENQLSDLEGSDTAPGSPSESNVESAPLRDVDSLLPPRKRKAQRVYAYEILRSGSNIEEVRRRCTQLDFPLLEEYDFRNDAATPSLQIDIKPMTRVRPYQEKSLSKMFGNGRARSGIIVLPCGAGKTLVGITAACTLKKSVLVVCTSGVSVEQWRHQFKLWCNVKDDQIAMFTSGQKQFPDNFHGILITTYTMIAYGGNRSYESELIMDQIRSRDWGMLLLDEVHVVPANVFRRVLLLVGAHTKLGLTATLVREDDLITDLNFLIGPKLYEANWMDLAARGYIANVQCAEVWCPMAPDFYREYIREHSRKRKLLYVMNPKKFQACQFLIRYHEQRGDKVIVFSDNIFALQAYAKKLNKPYIYGPTSQDERMRILSNFQHNPAVNCIFLSKVGDTSIDLPEATCLIQISSHYGSRRQEAQRLGRILRAKKGKKMLDSSIEDGQLEYDAFFYSLVSKDTQEMYYSAKRQQFLMDQGYAFKVIPELPGLDTVKDLVFSSKEEQLELLETVLVATENDAADESLKERDGFNDGETASSRSEATPKVSRRPISIKSLSGGDNVAYLEFKKEPTKKKPPHWLLRKFLRKT